MVLCLCWLQTMFEVVLKPGSSGLLLDLTGFDQQASNAVLDLVADEEELLKKKKSLTKW